MLKKHFIYIILLITLSSYTFSAEETDYFKLGKNNLDAKAYTDAIKNFQTALSKFPRNTEILIYLANTAYKIKKYDTAYNSFLKAFYLMPADARRRYLFTAAECAAFNKDFAVSKKYLEEIKTSGVQVKSSSLLKLKKYIAFKSEEENLKAKVSSKKREDYLNLAKFYIKNGYDNLAVIYYKKAFYAENRKQAFVSNEIARYFLKKGNKYLAKTFFLLSLEANPVDREATYNLGKIYFAEKDYLQSTQMFNRMRRTDNSYIPYLYLGEIYANTPGARFLNNHQVINEAINFLKEAEKRGARTERVYLLLSYLYRNHDETLYKKYYRYSRIFKQESLTKGRLFAFRTVMKIKRLKELVKVFKNDVRLKDIFFDLANSYANNEQFENAKETIKKVIISDKSNFKYYTLLGYCHLKLNETEKAIIQLNKAASLNPASGKIYYYLSRIYKRPDYYSKNLYIDFLIKAVRYSPNNTSYMEELAKYYYDANNAVLAYRLYARLKELGVDRKNLLNILKMKLEIKRLEENTSFSDNISKNHLRLISLRLMLNKSDKRVLYYINTAIRKQGNTKEILYLSALYNYSLFCSEYKKEYIQKAISILKKLNNNHPYFSDAYYLLSVIYLNGRIDLERASKSLSTLLKTCPGYDRIKVVNMIKVVSEGLLDEAGRLFGIGKKIYAKTGSDYALDYLLRAHKKDEKNEEIVMVLGEVYKKKDNFDKAVFYYKKAVSSANWNPGIYLALGNAYYAKFLNTPENINDLRKTLKLKSGFPFTEEGLNKLKERLTAVKNEAIKAYKTYIQQRMPFVVHPLHPSNPKNLVRILETLNISKGYLQNRIGLFFLKHDRYDEAINIFRKTLIASPNDRYTMLNLLSTFEKKNDRAGITNTLTRLAETFKNDLKLHIKLAAFYYEHKDFKNSLKYYIAASKLDDGIEANIGLGKAYFMLGNTEEAKKHYLKAISKMKNDQSLKNPECYFLLANIYMDEGKINLAIQNYLTALTGIKVNTFTAKFNLQKSMLREIYNKLSSLNLYMGNYVKAFNWLVEARIFDPSNRHKYEIALADILFLNKRFKYAISYYSDALNAEKNNPDLLFKIAVCYKELNQPRRSLKTLLKLKAVAKNKIKLQPLLFTGDIYLELGNKEKAYQNYSLALKKHPHDYRPYIKLALILKELNKSGEAARIIASNVYYIKQRYDISSFLAWYMAERNLSIQKALLWAKKAVLASPSNLTYLKTLAFLYYKSGDILNYFRVIKKTERLATELNIISTDYYNYFYSYQKACGYFRNKNFIMAVSILNNMRSILKLVHNEEIRSAAGSNQNNAVR